MTESISRKSRQIGSITVLTAVSMTVVLLFLGMVVDFGSCYLTKTKIQTVADSAVCAGALAMVDAADSTGSGASAAKAILRNYGYPSSAYTISLTQDTVRNPNAKPEMNVTLSQTVPTSLIRLAGIGAVNVHVLSEGISSSASGPFFYGLYSAGPKTLSLDYAVYNCSVYSGGNLNFNGGGIRVNGNVVAVGSITGYPGNTNVVTGTATAHSTTPSTMPDYTSYVASQSTTYNAGGGTYSLNGTVSGSVYVTNGNVSIGNIGTTNIAKTEVIMADGDITINSGNVTLSGSSQIMVYSRNGNVTFNGGAGTWNSGTVVAYAPRGTVNTGGGDTPFRSIVANYVNIYGGSINVNTMPPILVLPPGHVQLIR